VKDAPWWGLAASAAAPVVLVAGWTVAAALQPHSLDPVTTCVSALAAPASADRWVMTLAFAVAGACEIVTGLALRLAAAPGRLLLVAGGAAGLLVAANPDYPGGSLAHTLSAAAGFAALAIWPALARRRGPRVPWGLRPGTCAAVFVVLLSLLAWFLVELVAGGGQVGLAERVMGAAQAGWPLAVTASCRCRRSGGLAAARYRRWPTVLVGRLVAHAHAR